ncbi:MAG: NAD(P)/FAD-dependent oxidoreductase [Actinomycetota bacterium]
MADVIVVGAGHNGLICAAYLARAGIDTLLVEARADVGGCASTVSDLGARFNICSCDHTLIRAMPIADELELGAHGLRYLESDALGLHLFHDGADPWLLFHEVDRTIDAVAAGYPSQVEGYRRYVADAIPVAELVIDIARTTPTAPRLIGRAASARRAGAAARLLDWSRRSAEEVFARYFDDWHVTMPAIAAGPTVWGVPPSTPGTGLAALAYATRHLTRTGRPAGGSGALTDATRAAFEAAGGATRCDSRVDRILLDDGRVAGVRLTDGTELRAPVVVAACDPQRVIVDWLTDPPAAARALVRRWRSRPTKDGYESKLDAVIDGVPTYRAADVLTDRHPTTDLHGPTATVSPSPAELADAHTGLAEGRVAARPTLLMNVPSVADPSMRTAAGHHVLSLEVLFTPYRIPGGWEASEEPDRWLDLWAGFVGPGARGTIRQMRVMTPERYETEFSMHRGYTPAYAGSPLSALLARQPELTRYRTPIEGLYLSGAGTFPGAGVFGAAGRNTAAVVERDLIGHAFRRTGRRVGRRATAGARQLAEAVSVRSGIGGASTGGPEPGAASGLESGEGSR